MEEELEERGFKLVDKLWDSQGYDWSELALWVDTNTGHLYLYVGSGCSCNGPYDFMSDVGDGSPGDYMERIRNPQQIRDALKWSDNWDPVEQTNLLQAGTRALYWGGRQNMPIE